MRLILIRHGETAWNKKGRFQGHVGVNLNSRGFRQAQSIARTLKPIAPRIIYSSPLPRAMQTAQAISLAYSTSIIRLDELKELNLGKLDGLTANELQAQYPEFHQFWDKDPSRVHMPAGESLQQLQTRAWRAIDGIRKGHSEDTAVVVSHNFTITCIVCRVLGMPLSRLHRIRLDLGSFTTIQLHQRRWRLISFNEHPHPSNYNSFRKPEKLT